MQDGAEAAAVAAFEKKFKDKTKNAWAARDNFEPAAGKYTLLAIAHDANLDEAQLQALDKIAEGGGGGGGGGASKAADDNVKTEVHSCASPRFSCIQPRASIFTLLGSRV